MVPRLAAASRLIAFLGESLGGLFRRRRAGRGKDECGSAAPAPVDPTQQSPAAVWLSRCLFFVLIGVLIYGAWQLVQLVLAFSEPADWGVLLLDAFWTLRAACWSPSPSARSGRCRRAGHRPVAAAVAHAAAGRAGAGLVPGADALSAGDRELFRRRRSRWGEENDPTVLDWGSILLMLLGTQWYILFNVIAGAMAIPADLKEAARSYHITGWQRFRVLYFPALFPVPGDRLGDGGRRRLERQHRGRVGSSPAQG